jgi:hypothetical protein
MRIEAEIEGMEPNDGLPGAVENLCGDIENLESETRDKFDNMPDSLQYGDTGQLLEGRADSLQEWIDELQGLDLEGEPDRAEIEEEVKEEFGPKPDDATQEDYDSDIETLVEEKISEHWQEKLGEVQGCQYQGE